MSAETSDSGIGDHYAVLGVDPAADREALHVAYRGLARRLHPDVSGDDVEMKRLNAAWAVLGDPSQRAAYDRERSPRDSVVVPAVSKGPDARRPAMTYGRYEGFTFAEIARMDRPFLEWLRQTPGGRSLRQNIDAALAEIDNWRPTLGGRPVRSF